MTDDDQPPDGDSRPRSSDRPRESVTDMGVDLHVQIDAPAWHRDLGDAEGIVHRAVAAVLAQALPDDVIRTAAVVELAVVLVDDAAQRAMNRQYRGKDAATNVLSFPADQALPMGPRPLGDIAIAHGVAVREALDQGKTLADHLSHLVVHGVLHLLGHDHETPADAEAMEALERRVLAGLGVDDPYADGEVAA